MKAEIREEIVKIPTYKIAKPEKSPLFIEKRAYQGPCLSLMIPCSYWASACIAALPS